MYLMMDSTTVLRTLIERTHKPGPMNVGYIIGLNIKAYKPSTSKAVQKFAFFVVAGNRTIWCAIRDNPWWRQETNWINTANHDVCWCGDGINRPLSELYFALCKEVAPDLKPADVDFYNGFLFCPIMEKVDIEWMLEENGVSKKLISLRKSDEAVFQVR